MASNLAEGSQSDVSDQSNPPTPTTMANVENNNFHQTRPASRASKTRSQWRNHKNHGNQWNAPQQWVSPYALPWNLPYSPQGQWNVALGPQENLPLGNQWNAPLGAPLPIHWFGPWVAPIPVPWNAPVQWNSPPGTPWNGPVEPQWNAPVPSHWNMQLGVPINSQTPPQPGQCRQPSHVHYHYLPELYNGEYTGYFRANQYDFPENQIHNKPLPSTFPAHESHSCNAWNPKPVANTTNVSAKKG